MVLVNTLHYKIINTNTNNAVVKLGIEGKLKDNWYGIAGITILKKQ